MPNATQLSSADEKFYSQKARDAMDDSDFGDPENQAFPIKTAQDVINAASRLHNAKGDQSAIKARIKRIAKRKGFPLPQTWQDEDNPKESASPSQQPSFTPKSRIATFKTCFVSDGARSRNFGRTYSREAVNALLQSGQVALSTPNADPLTCYVNHSSADSDSTLHIAGKITRLWREGANGWAQIEMPDTHAARDAAVLVKNGYLKTSLRAGNPKYHLDKESGVMVIDSATLEGIDFTTTPGLETVTTDVLLESTDPHFSDIVDLPTSTLLLASEEGTSMTQSQLSLDDALREAYSLGDNNRAANPGTSGDSPFMTNDPTTDAYGAKMFADPPKGDPMMGVHPSGSLEDGMDGVKADANVQEAHDRIATVQARECAPSSMESATRTALAEAGRKLSADTHKHLDKAHDALAHNLGLACEGVPRSAAVPDADDAANSMEAVKRLAATIKEAIPVPSRAPVSRVPVTPTVKETRKPMSMEEAARLLEQAGYKIDRPKTESEKLQEAFDAKLEAKLAEQASRFEEQMKSLLAGFAPALQSVSETPQRKSQVVGANAYSKSELAGKGIYTHGAYLKEKMHNLDFAQLADRTAPLPEKVNVKWLLQEFGQMRMGQYFDRYGWPDEN